MNVVKKNKPLIRRSRSVKLMRIWHRRLREQLLTLLLSVQVFILFVMPTVRAAGLLVPQITIYVILLVFVALAIILSRSKVAIVIMTISVVLTIIGIIWRHEQQDLLTDTISTVGQVLTQLSLLWVVSSAVFGSGRITYHRILGAVVMYLGIGMIFTSLDMLLAWTIPGAFTHLPTGNIELRETLNYFSFGALTTGGFGDIVPVHPFARSLANLESICGQLFPATLLARIVGLHSSSKNS
jgi:hypothetical protein